VVERSPGVQEVLGSNKPGVCGGWVGKNKIVNERSKIANPYMCDHLFVSSLL